MARMNISREVEIAAGRNIKEYRYWMEKLAGEPVKSCFPFDYKKTGNNETEIASKAFRFADDLFTGLNKLSKGSPYTLHIVLLAALTALLGKYTGSDDILIGTPIYRQQTEDEFINTMLVIRNRLHSDITFKDLLIRMKQTVGEAVEHQAYPVELLPNKLDIPVSEPNLNENFPLFDVVVLVRAIHDKTYLRSIQPNFTFLFENKQGYIEGELEYNSSRYFDATIERILDHFTRLLQKILINPGSMFCDIEILSEEERNQLLFDFNDSFAGYPEDKTVRQLFEEQVVRTPGNIAVVDLAHGGRGMSRNGKEAQSRQSAHFTYRELDREAESLSRMLIDRGVNPDTIVGIMVDRSVEMLAGILAILKAGGAYLPIDPDYPKQRKSYMIHDSGTKVLLTTGDCNDDAETFRSLQVERILIEKITFPFPGGVTESRSGLHQPDNLAYIIYTSGTTGKPKGVMIEHKNVVSLMFNDKFSFDFNHRDIWTMFHSYCFDFSVWEMYGALLYGGQLVLISKMDARDSRKYLEILREKNVTILNQTPSSFYNLLELELKEPGRELNIRYIIFGGETLNPLRLRGWKAKYPGTKLINMYGITETTVHVTFKEIGNIEIESSISNIGKPIPTLNTYVVDKYLNLVPIGSAGEMVVGGNGVSRGYVNSPELTCEKFIRNPFVSGERLYRSGDLVKLTAGGEIEYLGRIDHQVKIRGFRVELGEIESQLLKHKDIKDAVATVRKYGTDDKYICAYIVAERSRDKEFAGTPTGSDLKQYLSHLLPDYMIPSYFIHLKSIPLTTNGKVDRKALPEPGIDRARVDCISPRDETEEKLARAWSEVLGIEKGVIGIDDNFFELGGHSLKAAVLMSRLHKEFDVKVSLEEIFKTPTIRELAEYFKAVGAVEREHSSIEPWEKKESYALSSAQKRLYVLQKMERDNILYNIPALYLLEGRFDKSKLEETFKKLIGRHESLRTSFEMKEGEPVQRIINLKCIEFQIEYFKTGNKKTGNRKEVEGISDRFIRPFDLSHVPLFRVGLIELPDEVDNPNTLGADYPQLQTQEGISEDRHILMFDMHHIVSDGISIGLFTKEFMALYAGEELPPLRLHYKDYSLWQRSEKVRESIKEQEEYWLKQFSGEIPVLYLPTDYPRPEVQSFAGSTVNFEVGKIETAALNKIAHEQGATLYMIMLAIFNILLTKISAQENIVIGTVIAGRMHMDLERIIGMFVNTLALRNYPLGHQTFNEFAAEVKERALKSFENQEYQFEDLVYKAAVKRDVSRNPIFDVMFVFQNIDVQYGDIPRIEIPDLSLKPFEYKNKLSKFDLNFSGIEAEKKLFFSVDFCTKLFKKETIERFIDYIGRIISAVTRDTGLKLYEIEILSEEEKEVILYEFNENRTEYPHDKTIRQLFEEQAAKTPGNTAVVGMLLGAWGMVRNERVTQSRQSVHLTYRKLDREAGALARILTDRGVIPDTIVGIMIEPSIEMIIGLLAVLKAGVAYLPIDPDYPPERIEYILADSGTKMLITNNGLFKRSETNPDNGNSNDRNNTTASSVLNFGHLNFKFVSSFESRVSDLKSVSAPASSSSAIAYIIYTSGSTGKPKGVIIEHRSLVNYVWWGKKQYIKGDGYIFPLYTTISFDLTVTSIYLPIISGNTILIYHNNENLLPIQQVLKEGIVDVVKVTPSHLRLLPEDMTGKNSRIKRFIVGGEQFESALAREIYTRFSGDIKVYNEYGPTEATVGCMIYKFDYESDREGAVPIGVPIDNSRVYILDDYLKPVPLNVVGVLYIGGDTLARGYINRPYLTINNFLPNPFVPGERIYRTGDLARRLADGNIEFLGRNDEQVKIRGFRIELAEIKNLLSKKEGIKDVVIVDWKKESGEKNLCSYIVSDEEIKVPEMREYLSLKLPEYMIPTYFIRLDELPLTSNGKLDRKRLPVPKVKIGSDYVAPDTEQEKKIADVWAEVLGLEKIGIHNNFFDLGGNSLDIIKLNSNLNEVFGRDIPLIIMFRYPTISKFGQYLDQEEYSQMIDRNVEKKLGMNRMEKMRNMKKRSRVK